MNDPRLEAMGDTPGSDVCGCMKAGEREAERNRLLMQHHERIVRNAPEVLRDPYRFGGRGSVLESNLARALILERKLREAEA